MGVMFTCSFVTQDCFFASSTGNTGSGGSILGGKWTAWTANGNPTGGRDNSGYMSYTFGGNYGGYVVDPTEEDATFIIGCAFNNVNAPDGSPIIRFMSDNMTTNHITIFIDTGGIIRVVRGGIQSDYSNTISSGGVLLGSTAALVAGTGAWRHLQAKVTLHDSAGEVHLVLDDSIAALDITGVDTKNGGTKTVFDSFQVASTYPLSGGSPGYHTVSDIVALNTIGTPDDFVGAVHVNTRVPAGNGTYSDGAGSDGNSVNNYALVDEAYVTSFSSWFSDYVDFAATGNKDTYTTASPVVTDATYPDTRDVVAVVGWVAAAKTDAAAREVAIKARLGGTDESEQCVEPLSNSLFFMRKGVLVTAPGGGGWTFGDARAAEFGAGAA